MRQQNCVACNKSHGILIATDCASARKEKIDEVITTSASFREYGHLRDQQQIEISCAAVELLLVIHRVKICLKIAVIPRFKEDFYIHQLFHANQKVVVQQILWYKDQWYNTKAVFNFESAVTRHNKLHNSHVPNSIPEIHKLQLRLTPVLFFRTRPIREKGVACESTLTISCSIVSIFFQVNMLCC